MLLPFEKQGQLHVSIASRCIALLCVSGVFVGGHLPSVIAGELNEELLKRAPAIIEYLNQQNYRNVGVLKFRVKRGDEPLSDSVGELNSMIAQRLELALVLRNPVRADRQIGVIRDASAMAAMIGGANHLTDEGRVKLLTYEYPLAWGSERVTPDAMLTGLIIVADDLSKITVGILAFDSRGGPMQRVIPTFDATANGLTLGEMGESFLTRGAFDGGELQLANNNAQPSADDPPQRVESPIQLASLVKTGEATFPLLDPQAPVKLGIWYDAEQMPIEIRDGRAYLPEPLEHQNVRFVLTRNGVASETYGVVLKVNGENTLYRHRRPAIECAKWVLYPHSAPIEIRGFQEAQGEMRPFRVLSQGESKRNEIRYGKDTGQISFTVFRQASTPTAPPNLLDEEAEDLLAMMRGVYPTETADSLGALKHQLLAAGRGDNFTEAELTRGLIVQSNTTEKNETRTVQFEPDSTPVLSATITYYSR